MNRFNVWAVIAITFGLAGCSQGISNKVTLKNAVDSASYALGVNTGGSYSSLSFPGEELDEDLIIAGFAQAIKGDDVAISVDESMNYLNEYFMTVSDSDADLNQQEGEEFLAQNKLQDGVVETSSGLQYQVLIEGTGAKPSLTDVVMVHYSGKLLDGTEFDSSIGGDPVTFGLDQVIEGWTEALMLMPVGSKYRIWLPSDLAYGQSGSGPIPGGSVLDFEVELLDIVE